MNRRKFMTLNIKETIEQCVHDSHDGRLTFPEVLGRLVEVGVESYWVDYRSQSSTYYLSNNEAICIPMKLPTIEMPTSFNKDAVISAIRGAQSDQVRYPEFLKLTMSSGCIGYIVWIIGRYVSYFGRQGEIHIEHFPLE